MVELQDLAQLVLDIQLERAAIAKNTYIAVRTGESEDLSTLFAKTDDTLNKVGLGGWPSSCGEPETRQ